MGRKKPTGDASGEAKNRPGRPVFARISDDTDEALQAFIGAQRFPPTLADIVEAALRDFLKREGFYPPKKKGGVS